MKAQIELTESEANALISIIDTANKSEGLKNAANCVYLSNKILAAFVVKEVVKKETQTD